MHVPPPQAGENEAVAMLVGPVSEERAELPQSTWNFQMRNEFVPKLIT